MFLDEIAARLVAQSVGTIGTNIFLGSRAAIPSGEGPYLSLIETGGSAPLRIHNVTTGHPQRPTAQVAVRGKKYNLARTMANNAYLALDGIYNTVLSGTFYQKVIARQEPTDIGLDNLERVLITFNIEVEKQPS